MARGGYQRGAVVLRSKPAQRFHGISAANSSMGQGSSALTLGHGSEQRLLQCIHHARLLHMGLLKPDR